MYIVYWQFYPIFSTFQLSAWIIISNNTWFFLLHDLERSCVYIYYQLSSIWILRSDMIKSTDKAYTDISNHSYFLYTCELKAFPSLDFQFFPHVRHLTFSLESKSPKSPIHLCLSLSSASVHLALEGLTGELRIYRYESFFNFSICNES